KSVKNRLSPPCGKVVGQLVHHTNLAEAGTDARKLVCYDCGVACDLSTMRSERIRYLGQLGASAPRPPSDRVMRSVKASRLPPGVFAPDEVQTRIRLRYTKLGRTTFLGHLDTMRVLMRIFRRAEAPVVHSRGFHPKPAMSFSPALSLGVASLGELVDVSFAGVIDADELHTRLAE